MTRLRAIAALAIVCTLGAYVRGRAGEVALLGPQKAKSTQVDVRSGPWSLRKEVETLGASIEGFSILTESLGQANEELRAELDRCLRDPDNDVLISALELKLARYAAQALKNLDRVINEQDALLANFRTVRRKLEKSGDLLGYKLAELKSKVDEVGRDKKQKESQLIVLAVAINTSPDEAKRQELTRQFEKQYRQFGLISRHASGYQAHLGRYHRLADSLAMLRKVFDGLDDKFTDLVDNLADERKYLVESVKVQADSLRVEKLVREGIVSGNRAIRDVSGELANLYIQVDAFNGVHERASQELGCLRKSQKVLKDVSKEIESIGVPHPGKKTDELVEEFFEKGAVDDER